MYVHFFKRLIDIVLSLLGIVLLSPLLLLIALLIKLDSKGPVLFRQKRVGKNKKYFNSILWCLYFFFVHIYSKIKNLTNFN